MNTSQPDNLIPYATLIDNNGNRPAAIFQHRNQRDGGLLLRHFNDVLDVVLIGSLADPSKPICTQIKLSPQAVFGLVHECRQVWYNTVVDYKVVVEDPIGGQAQKFPYQDGWSAAAISDEEFKMIGAKLAIAGNKLFFHIFEESTNQELKSIGESLRAASQSQPLTLTITSDDYFIPWSMVYTHPDGQLHPSGSNFSWEGFWGYRHIIEQRTMSSCSTDELVAENGQIAASFNFDEHLDDELQVECIKPQLDFFQSNPELSLERRTLFEHLRDAISENLKDQIIYFCCHGTGSDTAEGIQLTPSKLELSDQLAITASDISYWLSGRKFESSPVVFINACQGGQINTLFFKAFVPTFLNGDARAVIGPQIDMPALFASEYAQRFFQSFTSKLSTPTIGKLMHQLNRDFIDSHKNPLGLVYSLFRGADCYIRWNN